MLKLNVIGWIALVLVIIGALNWGLVGIFNGFDLVENIFGEMSAFSRIIYILVGLAAIYLVISGVMATKSAKHVMHRTSAA